MDQIEMIKKLIPILIPIAALQLGLMIYAVVDLVRRKQTKGPKWMWALIIVLVNLIGPVVYLIVGRKDDSDQD